MRGIIRLGDPTDHGGVVVEVSTTAYKVGGILVARKGDKCSCPKRGHANCTIAECSDKFKVGGIPVAFEGDKTSCGAVLKSTMGNFSKA